MTELILWTSREMNRLRRDVDRLLERLWVCFAGGAELPGDMKGPYFEIRDEGDNLVVLAEIPGARPEDVDMWIKNSMLYVECKKRSAMEEIGLFHRTIRESMSSFIKAIRLPATICIDEVTADYVDGIFRIVMPKLRSRKTKALKITVK